ncbi:uncharacterized protein LOC131170342 [Hevea brasiliensis]|uniref:uncharacterized protein LOC131170342 n=1 Tax=Hevea brasiliensis TaxID=3981 RepID=UPI0025DE5179|nr:uncharacterized protein LOC131170342 [Hevea brasiliensis]
MAGGDASKESRKRKREVSRKVREMKIAAASQTPRRDSGEAPGDSSRPSGQPVPEVEIAPSPPRQEEPPPPPIPSSAEGGPSQPTVRTLSRGAQDAASAQAQLSSAHDYIAEIEGRMKSYEDKLAEQARELGEARALRTADVARLTEEIKAKEEEALHPVHRWRNPWSKFSCPQDSGEVRVENGLSWTQESEPASLFSDLSHELRSLVKFRPQPSDIELKRKETTGMQIQNPPLMEDF